MVVTGPEVLALSIFSSYFLIILGVFTAILLSFPKGQRKSNGPKIILFGALAAMSFAHTWYCEFVHIRFMLFTKITSDMFKFMAVCPDNLRI